MDAVMRDMRGVSDIKTGSQPRHRDLFDGATRFV